MTEHITVSRELLQQMQALCMEVRQQSSPRMVALAIPLWDALRNALEQPAVEQQLMRLLASAWFYGGWKAETKNEQDMEALMIAAGWWPFKDEDALLAKIAAPQAQQPHRIGSGVTVEQALAQWEHDFQHPMTTEQQVDWVKREREFAASQAQQPQLLTYEEIDEIVRAEAGYGNNFDRVARAIKQASLRKNGVLE